METIRTFMAIELPQPVRQVLGEVSQKLAAQVAKGGVRWVQPDRIHLTVRFLGDTAVSQLPTIAANLDAAMQRHAAFSLRLARVGCFPNARRPRVIWVGLEGDVAALLKLKKDVDGALRPLGWEVEERPFQAHLTLGRVQDAHKLAGLTWDVNVARLVVPVTAVKLIESQLRPSGPIYTIRHEAALGKTT